MKYKSILFILFLIAQSTFLSLASNECDEPIVLSCTPTITEKMGFFLTTIGVSWLMTKRLNIFDKCIERERSFIKKALYALGGSFIKTTSSFALIYIGYHLFLEKSGCLLFIPDCLHEEIMNEVQSSSSITYHYE